MSDRGPREIKVWDPFVRVAHWTLVVLFVVAYLTEDDFLTVHVWAGYGVGVIIVMRLLWGFVGPRHARFADFACGPSAAAAYLKDLLRFRARRYLGHSPAGGLMVMALLVSLSATVATGIATYGAQEKAGPLGGLFAGAGPATPRLVTAAVADERGANEQRRKGGALFEDFHEFFANMTLVLVVLHVAGVLVASIVHRENLTRAMINGRKRLDLPDAAGSSSFSTPTRA